MLPKVSKVSAVHLSVAPAPFLTQEIFSSYLLNTFSKADSPPSFLTGQSWLTLLKILLEKEQSQSHWH